MRHLSLISIAAYAAFAFASAAYAQQQPAAAPPPPPPPAYGPPVTLEQAKKAVAAATTEAKKAPGYLFVFAVVDPAGNLVYFEKMDSAPTSSVDIAIGKAWTSATFKRPSKLYFDLMEANHSYFGTLHPRLTASAGGVPIIIDGKIAGAIGVSGGASGLMDMGAAQVGADALK
jgi:glc operon protein GlcG